MLMIIKLLLVHGAIGHGWKTTAPQTTESPSTATKTPTWLSASHNESAASRMTVSASFVHCLPLS
jgi:hypothetical protein